MEKPLLRVFPVRRENGPPHLIVNHEQLQTVSSTTVIADMSLFESLPPLHTLTQKRLGPLMVAGLHESQKALLELISTP